MNNYIEGTIIKGVGGLYTVRPDLTYNRDGNVQCRARGVFRYEKITPLPGDRVVVEADDLGTSYENFESDEKTKGNNDFVITKILERKNVLVRPPLANLTHLFVVIPSAKPKPDLFTTDKLLASAEAHNIEPVVIINKLDLDIKRGYEIADEYKKAGYTTFAVSAESLMSLEEIKEYILSQAQKLKQSGDVICGAFSGASGVGKSTLMSVLFPGLVLRSGDISRKTERGRHTTRHAELYPVCLSDIEMFIVDTPGFSMLDFERYNLIEPEQLPAAFREFREYLGECRYTKCTHLCEEGCAIVEAVKEGYIGDRRHRSYVEMYDAMKKKPDWKRRKEKEANGR